MAGPGAAFDPIAVGSAIQRRLGVKTSRNEPLGRFTTMRVGGPADLYAVAHNGFELRGLVRFARAQGVPFVLLGRGIGRRHLGPLASAGSSSTSGPKGPGSTAGRSSPTPACRWPAPRL